MTKRPNRMNRKNLLQIMVIVIILFYILASTTAHFNSDVKAQTSTCTPDENEGCVSVTKRVLDPDNLVDDSVQAALEFLVRVEVGGVGSTFRLTNGEEGFEVLNVGEVYTVTEVPPPPPIGVTVNTRTEGECTDITVQPSGTHRCVVINTIISSSTTGGAVLTGTAQGAPPTTPTAIESLPLGTASAQGGTSERSTGSGLTLGVTNPPFDVCKANFIKGATAESRRVTLADKFEDLIRAPNAATYTVGGKISLDKVSDALNMFGTRTMTIQVYSNFDKADIHLPLAISDPQFRGLVVVEDSDGIKHEVVKFNIYTIRTECKYITVAKSAEKPPDKNVYPLGVVGQDKDTTPSKIDELLVQEGTDLVTASGKPIPLELNPPFAICDVPAAASDESDNLGIYNVRGEVTELGSLHGKDLHVEINSDLVQRTADKAKITDNNNPYIKVNLVADEDADSAHKIPFKLHDLWTDCKDLSLHAQPIFEPIFSEIKP